MNIFREISRSITPHMRSSGFVLSGKSYYRIVNDVAYCIGFDMPGGLLYVTAYIMPLYIPCESKYYTYGNRLNAIQNIKLPVLNKSDDETAINTWCRMLREHIDRHIFPFFEEVGSPQKLMAYVDSHTRALSEYVACHDVYIWRLKLYTYLFTGDYAKASRAIACYRKMLSNVTFLSGLVVRKYSAEIDEVELIIQKEKAIAVEYCSGIISNTKILLQ